MLLRTQLWRSNLPSSQGLTLDATLEALLSTLHISEMAVCSTCLALARTGEGVWAQPLGADNHMLPHDFCHTRDIGPSTT